MGNKIKENALGHLYHLIERYPELEVCRKDILDSFSLIADVYEKGGKLLICGNGGSAADAEHIVGELMKGFKSSRPLSPEMKESLMGIDAVLGKELADHLQGTLPAIALDGHLALTTAYMNDCNPTLAFAQQVNGYGNNGDVLLGISTSGNSANVVYAVITAKAKGMTTIGLTGMRESKVSKLVDICIKVPEKETYKIQEYHLPVYHCLCLMLETQFFEN